MRNISTSSVVWSLQTGVSNSNKAQRTGVVVEVRIWIWGQKESGKEQILHNCGISRRVTRPTGVEVKIWICGRKGSDKEQILHNCGISRRVTRPKGEGWGRRRG